MIGLFVVSVVFFAMFLLIAVAGQGGGGRARALRAGVNARGIILWADKTALNSTLGGVRYESRALRLDVEVPGKPPYEVAITPLIPRICEALPGSSLDLRVDPKDPSNIAVLGPAGSLGWMSAMPQLFPRVGGGMGLRPRHVLVFAPFLAVLGIVAVRSGGEHRTTKATAPARSHEICEAAARCCSKVTPTAGCGSYKTMPESACKSALDAERRVAARMRKVCE